MEDLTDKQIDVLHFLRTFIAKSGFPPTIREIGAGLKLNSTNGVSDHLKALERKGYLRRNKMLSRGITMLHVFGGR